jgi:hypothetical protein
MIEVDGRVSPSHRLHPGAQTTPDVDPKSAEATRILRRNKGHVLVGDSL